MTQEIRRRIEALENAAPQSIWRAVHLTDDEIIDRAIERLSDEDLEILGQLSDDSEESRLPTEREVRRCTPSVVRLSKNVAVSNRLLRAGTLVSNQSLRKAALRPHQQGDGEFQLKLLHDLVLNGPAELQKTDICGTWRDRSAAQTTSASRLEEPPSAR